MAKIKLFCNKTNLKLNTCLINNYNNYVITFFVFKSFLSPGQDWDDGREEGDSDCADVSDHDHDFRRRSVEVRAFRIRPVGGIVAARNYIVAEEERRPGNQDDARDHEQCDEGSVNKLIEYFEMI